MTVQIEHTLGGDAVRIVAPGLGSSSWTDTIREVAKNCGMILGLDVESLYMTDLAQFDPDFRMRTVQLAGDDVSYVLRLDDREQRKTAREILSDETISFTSHSNMDVLSVWVEFGIDITGRNFDTLSPARMIDTDRKADRDLKTLAAEHGMPELPAADAALYARFKELWPGKKNAKKSDIEAFGFREIALDDPTFVLYAGLDAITVRRLAALLIALTEAPKELLKRESFLASRANRIQIRGMLVDRPLLEELHEESTTAVDTAKARFAEITDGVNAQYSAGVVSWFGEHGVNWREWGGARTQTGSPSLAKENVKLLLDFPLDETAQLAARELIEVKAHLDMKNKTTGVLVRVDPYGFVHPVLHPMGAETTARMSSAGPNFQNFSKRDPRMRGVFLPRPGYVFVTIDFDQVELRVVAALAREEKMIEVILADGDLHQLTVDEIAAEGIGIDRDTGKMTNFLIVYGGGAKALHEQAGIPIELAAQIVSAHRERYTSISAYSKYLSLQKVAVRTISGRRLAVTTNRKTGDLRVHANVNYAVQSAARELLVDSWYRFDREFGRGAYVWYPIHDELVLEVPEAEVEQVIADAERCMRFDFRGVPISATAIELRDEQGVSRWMTSKRAEKIAAAKVAA
jgi:DNA polymerase-1